MRCCFPLANDEKQVVHWRSEVSPMKTTGRPSYYTKRTIAYRVAPQGQCARTASAPRRVFCFARPPPPSIELTASSHSDKDQDEPRYFFRLQRSTSSPFAFLQPTRTSSYSISSFRKHLSCLTGICLHCIIRPLLRLPHRTYHPILLSNCYPHEQC